MSNCTSGISVAINLSLAEIPDFERSANRFENSYKNVIVSSGGDVPYSSGFYLVQNYINGDNFLEFGVSNGSVLYSVKVCIYDRKC